MAKDKWWSRFATKQATNSLPAIPPDGLGLRSSRVKKGTRFGTAENGDWWFPHRVDEGGLDTFEPHYTDIVEDEVQVYELVAVDVTGTPTNVLERASASAKDNRLCRLASRISRRLRHHPREGQAARHRLRVHLRGGT